MKQERRYRITTPTLAILTGPGQASVAVPVNEIITISETLSAGNSLVDVMWNDKSYRMFAQDLRDRCEPAD
jgi:hypothetical protein